ncbi:MAG: nucleotide exchange factor GrpE [Oscillospiraceae bacterium]|jgi:molecular chaperone GrpE|nr:nucleotide exchange factor GrpE [Oscillospiraceae bacterium]
MPELNGQPEPEEVLPAGDAQDSENAQERESAQDAPAANALEDELAALKDKHLRLLAEYDNFRKRSQREREALFGEIKADTVKKLLPVLDNLERACAAPCTDTAYAQGVEMTLKQCLELLAGLGVKPINAEGGQFDPNLHNAVMHVEDAEFPESTVVQVLQRGYTIGDKVLRHAMVKVAN